MNDDIPGSKCGSLRKSVPTTRNVNPLKPEYQIPGNTEIRNVVQANDPYCDFKKVDITEKVRSSQNSGLI